MFRRERIVERVRSLGYRAAEYTGADRASDAEQKDLLLRLGIAAFLSMNVMTFSLVIYASYFQTIAASFARYMPVPPDGARHARRLLLRRARFCGSRGPARAAACCAWNRCSPWES